MERWTGSLGRTLAPPTLCFDFSDDPLLLLFRGKKVLNSDDQCQDVTVATLRESSQKAATQSHLCSPEASKAKVWLSPRCSSRKNFLDVSQPHDGGVRCSLDTRGLGPRVSTIVSPASGQERDSFCPWRLLMGAGAT